MQAQGHDCSQTRQRENSEHALDRTGTGNLTWRGSKSDSERGMKMVVVVVVVVVVIMDAAKG